MIKKSNVFIILTIILSLAIPVNASAKNFGPDEWNQYRMKSDKNAVYNNDSPPLDFKLYNTANEVRATPVIVGNKMFIGNHDSGELFAFDTESGEQIWKNKAPNWIHSEMIYQDGMVYVGYGNRFFKDNGIRGEGDNGILALDADTGDIIWEYETEGEVMPTPAYYKDSVYITTGDRHLYKLNSTSGKLEYKENLGHTVSMSDPNIYNNNLYVGGSGPEPFTFSAYDLNEDKIKWQTEFPEVFAGLDDVPAAIEDDIVITTAIEGDTDDPNHMIYALDSENGEIIWDDSLGIGEFVENNKSGAPMIYKDTVFVGSPITKTFYAYDLQSGNKKWSFKNEVMKAPPVAQDNIVYFSNTKGYVYALDIHNGDVLGEKKLNGTLAPSGPVIINDTLFVGSQDDNVYAVPLEEIIENDDNNKQYFIWIIASGILLIAILFISYVFYRKKSIKQND